MIAAGLGLGHLPEGHRARVVLDAALGAAPTPAGMPWSERWDDPFWGLDRVWAWRSPSRESRARARAQVSRAVVEEAWFIEKLGLAYSARLLSLSGTTEERMLYALFGADEASHLAAFSAWVQPEGEGSAFHAALARLVEEADRATLVFVIQVVLEGWGLSWYRELAAGTRDPALAAVFEGILRDEARHHAAGLVFTADAPPGEAAVEALDGILRMVQAGPRLVFEAAAAELGPLSRPARSRVFECLDATTHVAGRLALLRRLMEKAGADGVVAALASRGRFTPPSAEDLA
jgi:hypothetical protein